MPQAPKKMPKAKSGTCVQTFMDTLEHPLKDSVQDLRALILSLDPRISEEIKWNAPSFQIEDHFATFKLHPPGSIQLVLHTGAKVKANPKQMDVADPHRLLEWRAKDRCILTLKSAEEAKSMRKAVSAIILSWISQLENINAQNLG